MFLEVFLKMPESINGGRSRGERGLCKEEKYGGVSSQSIKNIFR